MALNEFKPEVIKEMSMIEITYELMKQEKQPFAFNDLLKQVAEIKEMPEEEVLKRISYLYTDLNVDGRFICLGDNRWGLRTWYPYEQADEEITQTIRRKKAKKSEDDLELDEDFEDLDEELEDEYEDLEDELDELANGEDTEDEEEEDDDFDLDLDEEADDDDDLDEDLEEEDEDEDLL